MNHGEAFKKVPMPAAIARLPKDKRGYPIPYGNIIYEDGTPDFTALDAAKWRDMYLFRKCGICGGMMHGRLWFIGGPLCAQNRLFFDHPMHVKCAKYALQVCPFLALSNMHYRKTIKQRPGYAVNTVDGMSAERPSRSMLGKAQRYRLVMLNGQHLLQASEWEELTWWENGHEIHVA